MLFPYTDHVSWPLLSVNFPDSAHGTPSMDDSSAKTKVFDDDLEEKDYKFDFDLRQIDDLLPDEDEFFAGITDEIEPVIHTNNTEELEEFDVFGSGGGMELDLDPLENVTASFANSSIADGTRGNGISPFGVPSTVGTVAGEHPYGEHPSRTLFVRNINSNVEDSELRSLFEVLTAMFVDAPTFISYANPVEFLIFMPPCRILVGPDGAYCYTFSNMGISEPYTLQQSTGVL